MQARGGALRRKHRDRYSSQPPQLPNARITSFFNATTTVAARRNKPDSLAASAASSTMRYRAERPEPGVAVVQEPASVRELNAFHPHAEDACRDADDGEGAADEHHTEQLAGVALEITESPRTPTTCRRASGSPGLPSSTSSSPMPESAVPADDVQWKCSPRVEPGRSDNVEAGLQSVLPRLVGSVSRRSRRRSRQRDRRNPMHLRQAATRSATASRVMQRRQENETALVAILEQLAGELGEDEQDDNVDASRMPEETPQSRSLEQAGARGPTMLETSRRRRHRSPQAFGPESARTARALPQPESAASQPPCCVAPQHFGSDAAPRAADLVPRDGSASATSLALPEPARLDSATSAVPARSSPASAVSVFKTPAPSSFKKPSRSQPDPATRMRASAKRGRSDVGSDDDFGGKRGRTGADAGLAHLSPNTVSALLHDDFAIDGMQEVVPALWERVLVLDVQRGSSSSIGSGVECTSGSLDQLRVRAVNTESQAGVEIILAGQWASNQVLPGDFANVVGAFERGGDGVRRIRVDDSSSNVFIQHPDEIVSSTRLADSFHCPRKTVLNERLGGDSAADGVLGTIMHMVWNEALLQNEWTRAALEAVIMDVVPKHLDALFRVGESQASAIAHAHEQIDNILAWAAAYVTGATGSPVRAMNGESLHAVRIVRVLGVEQPLMSAMYALMGILDAVVEIETTPIPSAAVAAGAGAARQIVPIELKTGRSGATIHHRAQVALYSLLMSERLGVCVDSGLLYHMRDGASMSCVPSLPAEMRGLLVARNRMASFLHAGTTALPPMLRSASTCSRCHRADACMIMHAALENGDAASAGVGAVFPAQTSHIQHHKLAWLAHWLRVLDIEANETLSHRREAFTLPAVERQKLGRCFAGLQLVSQHRDASGGVRVVMARPRSPRRLSKQHDTNFQEPELEHQDSVHHQRGRGAASDLSQAGLSVGEWVLLSEDGPVTSARFSLAKGTIHAITRTSVIVQLRQTLRETIVSPVQRSATDIGDIEDVVLRERPVRRWRIDHTEIGVSFSLCRRNIVTLLTAGQGRARLASLIASCDTSMLAAPSFAPAPELQRDTGQTQCYHGRSATTPPSCDLCLAYDQLNASQRAAVSRALAAQDYLLILGMPGTGKTSTIAYLIRVLVSRGASVLLASYTHTAVDNVLLKLLPRPGHQDGVAFLRVGRPDSVHPQVRPCTMEQLRDGLSTTAELDELVSSRPVVATTCLGMRHAVFQRRKSFDYCIIDEASQITQAVSLGPLLQSRIFILVGDQYQLPPLVKSKAAAARGGDVSLFRVLSKAHPSAVVQLSQQYRMNAEILVLSNQLTYANRLSCGTEAVARARLAVPVRDAAAGALHSWLHRLVLCPDEPVVFLDLDQGGGTETQHPGGGLSNDVEALATAQATAALLAARVPASDIGVISPYRLQLARIRHFLGVLGVASDGVEIETVDRYQGRDKACILLSFVRCRRPVPSAGVLRDWRRTNVAVTRAKHKLIMLGSGSTLRGYHQLAELLRVVQQRNWYTLVPREEIAQPATKAMATPVARSLCADLDGAAHSDDSQRRSAADAG